MAVRIMRPDELAHGGKVHRQVDRIGLENVAGTARYAHRLVADALQVAVDLDHGEDEAQIDGHGLFLGQQLVGHLVQFTLGGVDGCFVLLHVLA